MVPFDVTATSVMVNTSLGGFHGIRIFGIKNVPLATMKLLAAIFTVAELKNFPISTRQNLSVIDIYTAIVTGGRSVGFFKPQTNALPPTVHHGKTGGFRVKPHDAYGS